MWIRNPLDKEVKATIAGIEFCLGSKETKKFLNEDEAQRWLRVHAFLEVPSPSEIEALESGLKKKEKKASKKTDEEDLEDKVPSPVLDKKELSYQ